MLLNEAFGRLTMECRAGPYVSSQNKNAASPI